MDPLTILLGSLLAGVLGATVLNPMETRVKRIMALEDFNEDLKARGLGTMAVNEAALADDVKALEMFKARMLAGLQPGKNLKDTVFLAHMMASQLKGGEKLEQIARAHGLVCPECASVLMTKDKATHGLEKMIGTKIQ